MCQSFGKMLGKLCSKLEDVEIQFSSRLPRVSHAVGLLEAHCASRHKLHVSQRGGLGVSFTTCSTSWIIFFMV